MAEQLGRCCYGGPPKEKRHCASCAAWTPIPNAPRTFRSVGKVNCHVSAELDLVIGTELFVRADVDAAPCKLCGGTGRYGDGANDGSGRWIECPNGPHGVDVPQEPKEGGA